MNPSPLIDRMETREWMAGQLRDNPPPIPGQTTVWEHLPPQESPGHQPPQETQPPPENPDGYIAVDADLVLGHLDGYTIVRAQLAGDAAILDLQAPGMPNTRLVARGGTWTATVDTDG